MSTGVSYSVDELVEIRSRMTEVLTFEQLVDLTQ